MYKSVPIQLLILILAASVGTVNCFKLMAQDTDSGQIQSPDSAADVPTPVPGAPLSDAYVQAVGRVAYLWGWPLVNMHNRKTTFAKAPYPGMLGGVLLMAPATFLRIPTWGVWCIAFCAK